MPEGEPEVNLCNDFGFVLNLFLWIWPVTFQQ